MMKKYFLILIVFFSVLFFGQNKASFSLEAKGNAVFSTGNNFIKDGLNNFVGFGIGFQAIIYKGLGAGIEINRSYADVKDASVFGSLKNSTLTDHAVYAVYQYPFTTKFKAEAQAGVSYMTLTSQSQYRAKKFRERSDDTFFVGTKFLYGVSKDGKIQIFAAPKLYFYSSDVQFDDKNLDKYYSKATLFNTSLGVRFVF